MFEIIPNMNLVIIMLCILDYSLWNENPVPKIDVYNKIWVNQSSNIWFADMLLWL